jgi:DNA mismatch endonuclease (patch repair protein)
MIGNRSQGGQVMNSVSKKRRSEIMRGIKRKDTPPEMVVRRLLFRMGLRFRLHRKDLPGKPDIVLPKWRTAIFVHGDFWHGCPRCYRGHRVPKTNMEFWSAKVARNQARDRRCADELNASGWRVVTIWECETHDEEALKATLMNLFPKSSSR